MVKQSLNYLSSFISSKYQIIDMVSTKKTGGGSGGLLRYEVLLENKGNQTHLELKEEPLPAIYPVATEAIPETLLRVMTTLNKDQGNYFSFYYNVVQIDNKSMLVRPRFGGNAGIHLDKQSDSETKDIIDYEAYTLGMIHSRSINDIPNWAKNLQTLSQKTLEDDVLAMTKHLETKFRQLKP
jgi:hypothetical protein